MFFSLKTVALAALSVFSLLADAVTPTVGSELADRDTTSGYKNVVYFGNWYAPFLKF